MWMRMNWLMCVYMCVCEKTNMNWKEKAGEKENELEGDG